MKVLLGCSKDIQFAYLHSDARTFCDSFTHRNLYHTPRGNRSIYR